MDGDDDGGRGEFVIGVSVTGLCRRRVHKD